MIKKEIKWEGKDYFVISTSPMGTANSPVLEPFDQQEYRAQPGDTITEDIRFGQSFWVTRVSGKDLFGYYLED